MTWNSDTIRERDLSRQDSLAGVYRTTMEVLASAISAKNPHERDHVKRVEKLCVLIGRKLSLDEDALDALQVASVLHDIGKLGVPDYILLKPGPLDQEEFAKTSNHAALGAKIIEGIHFPWPVADMVRHHHERFDGTGYPDRLAGADIPLGARIIAVAEVYDTLTSARCYKQNWSRREAMDHILKLSGTHFDPDVVQALTQIEEQAWFGDSAGRGSHTRAADHDHDPAELIAQASRELVSIFEIAETISGTLELEEVLDLLAHKTLRLMKAAASVVFLLDASDPKIMSAGSAAGRHKEVLAASRAQVGRGITGKVASRVRAYLGRFDPSDLMSSDGGPINVKFKLCMSAPIASFGRVIGAINLYGASVDSFDRDDLRSLAAVANRAALAIQNARTFEDVRNSAMTDPLTGLHNSRYLAVYLKHEIHRAARHGEPLSILQIDLDNFKSVNDSIGHQRGDEVLKDCAGIFRAQLRDYDLVARTGGDEFVVVLPGTSLVEATRTAGRIQSAVANYSGGRAKLMKLGFRASVGAATYPVDGETIDSLLEAADAQMYRDKRSRKEANLAA